MSRQNDFIKTQVRLPSDLHQEILKFANNYDFSMNTAIIEAIRAGLIVNSEVGIRASVSPRDLSKLSDEIANKVVERLKKAP
ncbi:hypothetical protein [Acinetobacter wuhouensis]|uniref:Arc family DNA-binding protein n=1 Tax=Acinetobacter wuhouensis TaxID=1879050 RepID=A0A3G2T1T3_9GAMM|nr:hypothetical protein [Acinetobacter wuhouensis]AYO54203.1 hypothetical protein CDG68_11405 [Acinetobacter wuhouensis]